MTGSNKFLPLPGDRENEAEKETEKKEVGVLKERLHN